MLLFFRNISLFLTFLVLFSCKKNESPLPCLLVEEEIENLENVKSKLTTNFEIDEKNNPIRKKTFVNDTLKWLRVIEYVYY